MISSILATVMFDASTTRTPGKPQVGLLHVDFVIVLALGSIDQTPLELLLLGVKAYLVKENPAKGISRFTPKPNCRFRAARGATAKWPVA